MASRSHLRSFLLPLPLLSLPLSLGPLRAQTCAYNGGTDPFVASGTTAGLLSGGGPGTVSRVHVLVPAVVFQNVPLRITDLSVSCPAGYRRMRFDRLTIRMGHTTVSQLSPTYAQNITSPLQDVLVAADHVWFEGFGPAWVPVGLQTPFQFLPGSGNLLVEVVGEAGQVLETTTNQSPGATLLGQMIQTTNSSLPTIASPPSPAPRLRFCADRAEVLLLGATCNGSAGSTPLLGVTGQPTLGGTATIWLSDAPPNAPAACAFGFSTVPPFPLLLTSLGAPGCRQYFPVAFADLVLANAVGVGEQSVVVPSAPATLGASVYTQYFVLDPPANALGITASNYARLLVGF